MNNSRAEEVVASAFGAYFNGDDDRVTLDADWLNEAAAGAASYIVHLARSDAPEAASLLRALAAEPFGVHADLLHKIQLDSLREWREEPETLDAFCYLAPVIAAEIDAHLQEQT